MTKTFINPRTYETAHLNKNEESNFFDWVPVTTFVGELQRDIDMLHAENALKLTQILDLEQLLYDLRSCDDTDGSPCWCYSLRVRGNHINDCIKARKATEPFWKK